MTNPANVRGHRTSRNLLHPCYVLPPARPYAGLTVRWLDPICSIPTRR